MGCVKGNVERLADWGPGAVRSVRGEVGQVQGGGDGEKSLVASPEPAARRQSGSGQKVGVNKANAFAKKRVFVDEAHDLSIGSNDGLGQIFQAVENGVAILQASQCKFADDKSVRYDPSGLEQLDQMLVSVAEMVDPY